ncbi:MAG: hypothetical protein PG981_000617 [Wolbachia endosymbiont of Ctenocephalides orientis wCori]|nr:MAG: hypothetical protein PG981_000617 [Wolbachia endosymbiont of Ctenocephalides orientis wCori]
MLSVLLEATKDADKRDIGAVLRELNNLQKEKKILKILKHN